eukprot:451642_1
MHEFQIWSGLITVCTNYSESTFNQVFELSSSILPSVFNNNNNKNQNINKTFKAPSKLPPLPPINDNDNIITGTINIPSNPSIFYDIYSSLMKFMTKNHKIYFYWDYVHYPTN